MSKALPSAAKAPMRSAAASARRGNLWRAASWRRPRPSRGRRRPGRGTRRSWHCQRRLARRRMRRSGGRQGCRSTTRARKLLPRRVAHGLLVRRLPLGRHPSVYIPDDDPIGHAPARLGEAADHRFCARVPLLTSREADGQGSREERSIGHARTGTRGSGWETSGEKKKVD